MKRIIFLLVVVLIADSTFGQNEVSQRIDSLLKVTRQRGLKVIKNWKKKNSMNVSPRVAYVINKKTSQLRSMLIFNKEKAVTYYFVDNHLVKALVQISSCCNKVGDGGLYYFQDDSLVYKKETNIEPQDIAEIQGLAKRYMHQH